MPVWLVLCHDSDAAAHWACDGLMRRGLVPMLKLTETTLARAVTWTHRIGPNGADFEMTLPDGPVVQSTDVLGVLNRLTGPPLERLLPLVAVGDRVYASQEMTAFYLSWLHSLPCPVINQPTPQGLCGRWRHASEWACLAAEAGLPTASYWQTALSTPPDAVAGRLVPSGTPSTSVVVVGCQVVGVNVPPAIQAGCIRLASLAGETLLGIDFVSSLAGAWTFAGATPLPDLRSAGTAVLDALADAFRGRDVMSAAGAVA